MFQHLTVRVDSARLQPSTDPATAPANRYQADTCCASVTANRSDVPLSFTHRRCPCGK